MKLFLLIMITAGCLPEPTSTSVEAYVDADGDGVPAGDGVGYDCNDNDSSVHPGAGEICDDGINNDCDDEVDEVDQYTIGSVAWWPDADGDGHGDLFAEVIYTCSGDPDPNGSVLYDTDCDDSDSSVHLGAEEICDDGIDNDCNGVIDDNDCLTSGDDTGDVVHHSVGDTG
jgi:hypothetical protein